MKCNEEIATAIDVFKQKYPEIEIVFLSLCGSHLFGTASENSDYDLRGCFTYKTQDILLNPNKNNKTIEFKCRNVEIAVHEIYKFLNLILKGNMNFIEEVLSPLNIITSETHEQIKMIASESLTKEVFPHIQGMSIHTKRHAEKECYGVAKRDLYIFRELLRGIVLFKHGNFVSDIVKLAVLYDEDSRIGFPIRDEIQELIELKKSGKEVTRIEHIKQMIHQLEIEMVSVKEFGILRSKKCVDTKANANRLILKVRSFRKPFVKLGFDFPEGD